MELLTTLLRNYPQTIDFLFYFFFFGATTRVGLTSHFGDHLAKRIAIPMGLILATSLVIAQQHIGFQLEKLGPFALGLIVLAILIMVYKLLEFAKIPTATSIVVTGLFTLAFARTLAPQMTNDLMAAFPLPALLLFLLLGLEAWAIKTTPRTIQGKRNKNSKQQRFAPDGKTLRKLRKDITRKFRKQNRNLIRDTKHGIHKTRAARKSIRNQKTDERGKPQARDNIRRANELNRRVIEKLDRLHQLDRAIQEIDHRWLTKNTEIRLNRLPTQARETLKQNIDIERKKLLIEEHLDALAEKTRKHAETTKTLLETAEQQNNEEKPQRAEKTLQKAEKQEHELLQLENEIGNLEHRLIVLFKQQEWLVRNHAR